MSDRFRRLTNHAGTVENKADGTQSDACYFAGEDGENEADGLTTRSLYDSNLADGVGLDSAAGIAVSKPGGGAFRFQK